MKQWKRLAALSSAIVMAAATLTYFPSDTLQNIPWKITANAETTTEPQVWIEDNLTWTLDANGTLTISGTGAMKAYDSDDSPAIQKKDSVKTVVIEDGVTSIGDSAFFRCSQLASIEIPSSVKSIGDYAFYDCTGLTSITIPKSVTSIGNYAFYGCDKLTVNLENGSELTSGNLGVDASKIRTYWNEDNLTWTLDADGTLNISGKGAMKDYNSDDNPSPVYQNSNVKKVVIEKGVTSIGNYAFSGCLGLKSITIPDGITSIGDHAFDSCINLRSITLPDSITSIGMWAFYNCWNVPSIIIPDGVTSIEDFTFDSCIGLTSITIPNSIINIKSSAFHNCAKLASITIPDSVTSIGESVFGDCSNLTTISLSCGSVLKKSDFGDQADLVSYTNQHILTKTAAKDATCSEDGNKAYWTCEHCGKYFLSDDTNPATAKAVELSETVIPASHKLTKVEAKAATCTEKGNKEYWTCEHCGKYFLSDDTNPETATAVELSETVVPAIQHKNAIIQNASEPTETAPGYSGDRYCPDCDKVVEKGYTYWVEDNLTWKLYADGTLTISGTGAMKDYDYDSNRSPVYRNSDVKKVVIEDGVTSIGSYAFQNCRSLTNITIPNSVTSIGNSAFEWCSSLSSVTIPDSVTSIGEVAFYNCSDLTSITIPDSVTSIGKWAFFGCGLTSITIPDSVTSIEESVFESCSSLTSITIPDSVTSIGSSAFFNCQSLTNITIPDSVTSIGNDAFRNCTNLTTISLSCKSTLKKSDFGEQADLVSASHTLKKTEAKAATCTEKGNKEYWTCEHCGKYFLSDDANPETAKAVEQSETILPALKHKNATTRGAVKPTETDPGYSGDRYCPDCNTILEKGYTYWVEDNLTWKLYEDGTLNISGTGAMKDYNDDDNPSPAYKNSNVKKIVIEKGVTSVGESAFENCSSLTSVMIPDSVISIGTSAFHSCNRLTSITLPDSVTSIGNFAFEWCSGLSSITLSNNITSIGDFAFHGCPLTSITIPDSVTSIGEMAFHSCSNLTSITIPDSVTSIGYNAFENCSSLTTISLSCKSSLKKDDFGDQADLVSYASHTLKKTEAKAATYAENGNKAYWTCEHCGKYFLSDDTNPETATAVELSETVIPALVQVATTTTPIKCVYGQDMNKIDLRDYVKNTDVVGEVSVKVATGSALPDGMKLDGSKLSGKPAKAYEDGKEVTFTFTAENGSTANLTLLFLVAKADPTVEVAVSGDSHTEGDLVKDLELILSGNSTKGVVQLVSEIKTLIAGKNTLTWKFMPEDENNYHAVTGTVVVNAQTTTTTTTKATTTTTKATTTTKPSKTTTTNATTTTKPSKTTTTKATTTTKPSKTTTTNATTTTKPSKTTTTKVTTTTKPSKTTTTNATTTTKPSKTTTTKVTTTTITTTTNTAIPSYGDVNLDGKVDIVDAIFLNKYLATLIQFSDAQMANADCCQDGVLNDQDTTALMQFIILLIDDLPVQPTEK